MRSAGDQADARKTTRRQSPKLVGGRYLLITRGIEGSLKSLSTSSDGGALSEQGAGCTTVAVPENRVFAVVVTHNGAPWIEQCLHSLMLSHYAVQVIVVDNASSDATRSLLTHFPGIACLAQDHNLGFARANNIGIREALDQGADFVLLLNQDACVRPHTVGKLVGQALENRGLGILSPFHLNGDGTDIDARFLRWIAQEESKFFADLYLGRLKEVYPIHFVNAAAWLLTRECLNRVGGFDPLFFMYGEDDDYCKRAALHGFGIGLVPSASIFHVRGRCDGASEGRWAALQRQSNRMVSSMLVGLKWPSGSFAREFVSLSIDTVCDAVGALLKWEPAIFAAIMLSIARTYVLVPRIRSTRRMNLDPGPQSG